MSLPKVPFKINPVQATCTRCDKSGGCGIHEYNDICFSVCGAYSGVSDPYMVDKDCAKQCSDMIEEKRHEFYDAGTCDHQQPYKPVIWDENPAFFVSLLRQGVSPEEALVKSKQMCMIYKPNSKEDCINKQENLYFALDLSQTPEKQVNYGQHLLTYFPSSKDIKVNLPAEKKIPFWLINIIIVVFIVTLMLIVMKI